ncbi:MULTISPECIES: hypothetical protein [unclassified Thermoactinomyces]|uniref:hypothetical protein n=1 Tax=unclassified Thermoactinomyces TaxID=2634588 RepID=UPI0018DDC249|nr:MULTISPECIES: hypothetical protein [unclassified Thermoactinomyces]MBH8605744.1 hypothetical protein [Thermoactinomyces sp. CICC 10522]MBH8608033.1 hypothetical protein [Thermoactinomyces sp. CICC 10521]
MYNLKICSVVDGENLYERWIPSEIIPREEEYIGIFENDGASVFKVMRVLYAFHPEKSPKDHYVTIKVQPVKINDQDGLKVSTSHKELLNKYKQLAQKTRKQKVSTQ